MKKGDGCQEGPERLYVTKKIMDLRLCVNQSGLGNHCYPHIALLLPSRHNLLCFVF